MVKMEKILSRKCFLTFQQHAVTTTHDGSSFKVLWQDLAACVNSLGSV